MIHLIANTLTKYISSNIEIDDDMMDVYKYGIEITISSMLNVILIIISSIILSDIICGIIFLTVFIFLRSFCGGYHAGTYLKCNLVFVLTFLLTFSINKMITNFFDYKNIIILMIIVDLLSFIPIAVFSPVQNKNKAITANQTKICHLKAMLFYLLLSIISFIICVQNINYGSFMIIALASVSVMILIEITKRRITHER